MNGNNISDEIVTAKIRRALLSGPASITREATVAEMDAQGEMTVLRPGTNQWGVWTMTYARAIAAGR
jgi:hypothetical protein